MSISLAKADHFAQVDKNRAGIVAGKTVARASRVAQTGLNKKDVAEKPSPPKPPPSKPPPAKPVPPPSKPLPVPDRKPPVVTPTVPSKPQDKPKKPKPKPVPKKQPNKTTPKDTKPRTPPVPKPAATAPPVDKKGDGLIDTVDEVEAEIEKMKNKGKFKLALRLLKESSKNVTYKKQFNFGQKELILARLCGEGYNYSSSNSKQRPAHISDPNDKSVYDYKESLSNIDVSIWVNDSINAVLGKSVIISYKGTQPKVLKEKRSFVRDLLSDLRIVMGVSSTSGRVAGAVKKFDTVYAKYGSGYKYYLTSHSLGGNINMNVNKQRAEKIHEVHNFNGAIGLSQGYLRDLLTAQKSNPKWETNITNHIIGGTSKLRYDDDPVSILQGYGKTFSYYGKYPRFLSAHTLTNFPAYDGKALPPIKEGEATAKSGIEGLTQLKESWNAVVEDLTELLERDPIYDVAQTIRFVNKVFGALTRIQAEVRTGQVKLGKILVKIGKDKIEEEIRDIVKIMKKVTRTVKLIPEVARAIKAGTPVKEALDIYKNDLADIARYVLRTEGIAGTRAGRIGYQVLQKTETALNQGQRIEEVLMEEIGTQVERGEQILTSWKNVQLQSAEEFVNRQIKEVSVLRQSLNQAVKQIKNVRNTITQTIKTLEEPDVALATQRVVAKGLLGKIGRSKYLASLARMGQSLEAVSNPFLVVADIFLLGYSIYVATSPDEATEKKRRSYFLDFLLELQSGIFKPGLGLKKSIGSFKQIGRIGGKEFDLSDAKERRQYEKLQLKARSQTVVDDFIVLKTAYRHAVIGDTTGRMLDKIYRLFCQKVLGTTYRISLHFSIPEFRQIRYFEDNEELGKKLWKNSRRPEFRMAKKFLKNIKRREKEGVFPTICNDANVLKHFKKYFDNSKKAQAWQKKNPSKNWFKDWVLPTGQIQNYIKYDMILLSLALKKEGTTPSSSDDVYRLLGDSVVTQMNANTILKAVVDSVGKPKPKPKGKQPKIVIPKVGSKKNRS